MRVDSDYEVPLNGISKSPERKLLCAVLERVLRDLQYPAHTYEYREAVGWCFNTIHIHGAPRGFSLGDVVNYLDTGEQFLRKITDMLIERGEYYG